MRSKFGSRSLVVSRRETSLGRGFSCRRWRNKMASFKKFKGKIMLSISNGRNGLGITSRLADLNSLDMSLESAREKIRAISLEESNIDVSQLKKIKRIGEGGFAIVELHELTLPDGSVTKVAVKILKDKVPGPKPKAVPGADYEPPPMVSVPPEAIARFEAEAVLTKLFKSKNVVKSYGIAKGSDKFMFVQECCSGGSLLDKIQRPRSYSAEEALGWAVDTARGLAYLQGSSVNISVAHRDLKPENILISDEGVAKIADFGLSRMMDPEVNRQQELVGEDVMKDQFGPDGHSFSKMTRQTGTARYMAPECFTSTDYSRKVDVFSYGIMIYELWTRKRAYEDLYLTMDTVAKMVATEDFRPAIPKHWPPELKGFIEECWDPNPEVRPEFDAIVVRLTKMMQAINEAREAGQVHPALAALEPPMSVCCTIS